MWIVRILAIIGTLSGVSYYAVCLWATRWFFLRRRAARHETMRAPVSILKPLCGADPNAYENLRSHCIQQYPEFEIIFGVSDPEDIVIPLVQRLMAEFPEREIRLVVCSKFLGSNYKISNLIQMFPLAKYDYVLVNDSDICVRSDYLQQVMNEFQDTRVGMVTSLYRGIAGETLGAKLEGLGICTDFIPGVLTARQIEGGIQFGLGSTLAFHRKALKIIGGFECVADYLGDDYELGRRISEAGFAVALAGCVVDHHLPDYSFGDYLRHQLRWNRGIRNSRPKGYTGLILTFGLPWGMFAVVAAPHALWAWSLLAVAVVFRYAVAITVGAAILQDAAVFKQFWLIPLRDVISVGIWIASLTGRRVVWRGNEFKLENGKLRS